MLQEQQQGCSISPFHNLNRQYLLYCYLKPEMLQEKLGSSEDVSSYKELKEYKKANHSLRRKLKPKQTKIQQLFGYIQEVPKVPDFEGTIAKNHSHLDRHQKLTLSENRKKEKQNKNSQNYQEFNIFKHPSINAIHRANKQDLRLPSLQKKGKNIFAAEEWAENPEKRSKVVRIPLERLKPIDSQQIKKRFLQKYARVQSNIE